MRWSLSEFLNLVELRSQCWCLVALDETSGFHVLGAAHSGQTSAGGSPSDVIHFYAVLDGQITMAGPGGPVELDKGDVIMILSGRAHAFRVQQQSLTVEVNFLTAGEYVDAPPTYAIGSGTVAARLLAGRLKVRWPAGQSPRGISTVLKLPAESCFVDIPLLIEKTNLPGTSALLTRVANAIAVAALREDAGLNEAFNEFTSWDPVLRAQEYFRRFPFHAWSIDTISDKVGLGRSNFATRFAKAVGTPPMEFLKNERMKHAALFLEKTDMKVGEIADRVGYRSEPAFIRRFSSMFGMTPGELRKSRRVDGSSGQHGVSHN